MVALRGPEDSRRQRPRRLFVDVSLINARDAGTGIQRCVRELFSALRDEAGSDIEVLAVTGTGWLPYRRVLGGTFGPEPAAAIPVLRRWWFARAVAGDAFLGLDLAPPIIRRRARQLRGWQQRGVSIGVVLYDMLPLLRPQWFTRAGVCRFTTWVEDITGLSDTVLCISGSVERDYQTWLDGRGLAPVRHPRTAIVPLGSFRTPRVAPADQAIDPKILAWMAAGPTVLVVGTLEPRKGHDQVLAAFERLWTTGAVSRPRLLIVGRPGWGTEALQARLRQLGATTDRLLWLDDASDNLLDAVYERCSGVLVASRGEGFGLPLLEAVSRRKPTLARDLPVFREFAPSGVWFFEGDDPDVLAERISTWLADGKSPAPPSDDLTWARGARTILDALLSEREAHRSDDDR